MSERFVFFGTGANFTMGVLGNLQKSGYLPSLVVVPEFQASQTKPGFELQVQQPGSRNPLIMFAEEHNIAVVYAPQSRFSELTDQLSGFDFEFILVACWPYKIPAQVCKAAKKAAMNIHPSLLPAYRGADPIGDQIANREQQIGVSLHLINNQFDAGDIIAAAALDKPKKLERVYLEKQAARFGAKLFMEACGNFGGPGWHPRPQL
jgi:methionyl-tRNA formyltransferase